MKPWYHLTSWSHEIKVNFTDWVTEAQKYQVCDSTKG